MRHEALRRVALRRVAPDSTFKWKPDQFSDVATIALVAVTVITLVLAAST